MMYVENEICRLDVIVSGPLTSGQSETNGDVDDPGWDEV